MIASLTFFGMGEDNGSYYIYAQGKFGITVYFTEEGHWVNDKQQKAISSDFDFVYEHLGSILKDKEMLENLEASLLF